MSHRRSPPVMSIHALKQAVRKQVKSRLRSVSQAALQREAQQAAHALSGLPEFLAATNVGLYMELPQGELPTNELLALCFRRNMGVYLPRVTSLAQFGQSQRFAAQKATLRFLAVHSLGEVGALPERGKYKIREPEFEEGNRNDLFVSGQRLDILFVPGMAFSRDCRRLGHGAGFYDDFIKRYQEVYGKRPLLYGLGLEEQLVEELPVEEHDERLDGVILGGEVYRK